MLPDWLKMEDDGLVVLPDRAKTIQDIYYWTIEGYSARAIVKRLAELGQKWTVNSVAAVLKDRQVVGEYQPMALLPGKGKRVPDGPPLPNFLPAIITEEEWLAAREASGKRRKIRGAIGSRVNVFAGLLIDAVNGSTYQRATSTKRGGDKYDLLLSRAAQKGMAKQASFQFEAFEELLLGELSKIPSLGGGNLLAQAHDQDDAVKLRGLFRRELDGIWIVVAKLDGHKDRFCIAQVRFKCSTAVKTYLLWYYPVVGNGSSVQPTPEPRSVELQSSGFDLRNQDDATAVAARLGEGEFVHHLYNPAQAGSR